MPTAIFTQFWHRALPLIAVVGISQSANTQTWGRLANPGFENQRIKATLFFAGQARDGTIRYNNFSVSPFKRCDPGNDARKFVLPEDRQKYAACMVDAEKYPFIQRLPFLLSLAFRVKDYLQVMLIGILEIKSLDTGCSGYGCGQGLRAGRNMGHIKTT